MNREIKFRAWHPKLKQFAYFGLGEQQTFTRSNGVAKYNLRFDELRSDRFPITQFTGLHDKNGKEIYEGDIVRGGMYIRNKWTEGVLLKVEYWGDGVTTQSGFRFTRENGSWEYQALLSDIEVIGNIYENPELLTPKSV